MPPETSNRNSVCLVSTHLRTVCKHEELSMRTAAAFTQHAEDRKTFLPEVGDEMVARQPDRQSSYSFDSANFSICKDATRRKLGFPFCLKVNSDESKQRKDILVDGFVIFSYMLVTSRENEK